MFPGGVYLGSDFGATTVVGQFGRWPIRRHLELAGCRTTNAPEHAMALHVGAGRRRMQHGALCWADGWAGLVGIEAPADPPRGGNEIGGVLAGAMGIGEVFRSAVLGDKLACRSTSSLSALSPGCEDGDDIDLAYLPAAFWLLGLGNLGQATLWTMGLLPYSDPGLVSLFLQDADESELGNLAIQILTKPGWIGRKKARSAALWAEERGFGTTIIESRFVEGTKRSADQPGLALVGVDNLAARRAAAGSNFDLVLDAGLGGTPSEIFDIRIHGFPGTRSPEDAWPEPDIQPETPLDACLQDLVDAGRIDRCGAITVAGRSLGVPSTAVAAAAIQVAQACRAVRDGNFFDLVDVTLVNCRHASGRKHALAKPGILPFIPARWL
jgi:molybdopterin/thiamine biosynthesis adenylyltransferase